MNKNLGLLALTGILTLASCGQSNDNPKCSTNQTLQNGKCVDNATKPVDPVTPVTPVTTHKLTVVVNGDTKNGTFTINTPSGDTKSIVVVDGSASLDALAAGKYTVTANNLSGYTFDATSKVADLTSSDATVTFTTTKTATAPTTGDQNSGKDTGTVFGHFHVDAGQQMLYVSDKNSDDFNSYQPQSTTGAWRAMGQGITNGEEKAPAGYTDLFVKGKVNFNVDVTAGKRVEVLLARTTGRDVPTATETQAADVLLNDTASGGTASFTLDSTRLGEYEGVREWLILRVDGAQLYYQPIIADNSAPTQPEPAIRGIDNKYSSTYGNWARGDVRLYSTTSDIVDKPDQAPPLELATVLKSRRASGFDGVRYYLVPDSLISTNLSIETSNLVQRAAALKALAANNGDVIKTQYVTVKNPANTLFPFESDIGSGTTSTLAKKAKDGVVYRIYAISRDQLGNEAASATYQKIGFDNVGPTISCNVIRDASPLPFPSSDPTKFISGRAQLVTGTVTDASGVGIDPATYNFNLGGKPIMASDTDEVKAQRATVETLTKQQADAAKVLQDAKDALANNTNSDAGNVDNLKNQIAAAQKQYDLITDQVAAANKKLIELINQQGENGFDSRQFGDGEYSINYAGVTDFLGNPVQASKDCGTIIIDNTAPTVGFNRPSMSAAQTFTSGETVTVESTSNDAGSGVYRTLLFWDDSQGQNLVGSPAEFYRSNDHKSEFIANETNNASWIALANINSTYGSINNVKLKALAIDRAGNATIISDPIKVQALANNTSAYLNVNTDWTTSAVINATDVGINKGAMLNSVDTYGRFAASDWDKVNQAARDRLYDKYYSYYKRDANGDFVTDANGPILITNDASADVLAAGREWYEWYSFKAPLLNLGNIAKANNQTSIFTYKDDTLNNLYWGRGFGGSTYSYLLGLSLNAHYDQYNVVPTDSYGAYGQSKITK